MREILQISFSGGRTSAYMTHKILTEWRDKYEFIVTFANTGLEHPKTLEFIKKCDDIFGFNTVWLEAVVHPGRIAPTHKIVTYETASRAGEPFEEVIKKYGIPNTAFPGCTRDLKLNPMRSYLKSIGLDEKKTLTAIGIRADEKRRVNPKTASERSLIYPLIEYWPTDKIDVLDWWGQQQFDLEIDEFEGNCCGCFKKSFNKHFLQIQRDPSVYDFHRRMELLYKFTGPQHGARVFFRGNRSTEDLFKLYEATGDIDIRSPLYGEDGGCSESCEVFETTQPQEAAR